MKVSGFGPCARAGLSVAGVRAWGIGVEVERQRA